MSKKITLKVNGQFHIVDVEPDTPLLYVLRNDLVLSSLSPVVNFPIPFHSPPVIPQRTQTLDALHWVVENGECVYFLEILDVSSLREKTESYGLVVLQGYPFDEIQHLFGGSDPVPKHLIHLGFIHEG